MHPGLKLLLAAAAAVLIWIGFTVFCWVSFGQDPQRVLRTRWNAIQSEAQQAEGAAAIARARSCFPERINGWDALPVRNDLAGTFYTLLHPIELRFDQRRPDGSDDLILRAVVNPSLEIMSATFVNPVIPDGAKPLEPGSWTFGFIHDAYDWDFFLPPFDRRSGHGKAFMAQIFIGDWELRPLPPSYLESQKRAERELLGRELQIREIARRRSLPRKELLGLGDLPSMGVFAAKVEVEALSPMWRTPSSRVAVARSLPDLQGKIHPRCIAVMAVAKDEATLRWLLGQVDWRTLDNLTRGY